MSTVEISAFRRAVILGTLTVSTALYAMTVTIANVSLPQIQGALSATQDEIAWIVTFNIVATAVTTPMTGWLATRFGDRNVMVYGVLGFTIATFLCGTANTLAELVFYRILQGTFGAPLVPLSQAIVLATYPKDQHGMATAVYGMGVVIGPIFAPTIGGYLSETYNWRWVFFMIVPVGVACLLGVMAFIHDREGMNRVKLDWTGFLALATAIACFQLMLDRGERNDWFESTEIVLEAIGAFVAFYIFIAHSLTASAPFLNPKLLLDRNFVVGLVLTLNFGMLNFTPMVLLPSMLQGLQGYPDSVIGLLLGTRAVGTLLGFSVMIFGSRFDPRIWLFSGFGLQGLAGIRMSQFSTEVPIWDIASMSCMQGLGVGLLWVPLTLVTFRSLSPMFLAEGTAVFHLLRNIGSSIHISISVAVVIHTSRIKYSELAEFISPYNESLQYPWLTGAYSTDSTSGLAAIGGELARQSAMVGYVNAFHMYSLTAFAALPLLLLVGRPAARR